MKAQVHAGGRGKAGFVKLCTTPEEVADAATFMLNNAMVSNQTGPEGLDVSKLLIGKYKNNLNLEVKFVCLQ